MGEEFAARIGLDWADKKHDVCLQIAGSTKLERTVLKHTPESIDEWVQGLRKLASYRKTWTPSGAKDDIRDAELLLDMPVKHPEQLKRLEPQSADMRALGQLVEQRRRLVSDRVRITNRLTYALKAYYPQVLEWFEDKATKLFCDFLEQWPSIEQARAARRDKLEAFFRAHNVRGQARIEERIGAIKSAGTLTEDPGVVRPAQLLVAAMVGQLRPLLDAVGKFDEEIATLSKRLSDYDVFDSFPATGEAFLPRLQAAFGEDRSRFDSAAEVQRYAGIAPVTEQSGQSCWVHWRFKCSTFLRQTFVEWAAQTIPLSFWAGAYYQQQRARGASHQGAVRSLAFKWIRILFRCWKTGTRYDESRYLKHLQSRGSKLLTFAASHPENG